MSRYTKHIFVCQNERPADHPRGCCKLKGSEELLERLKSAVKARGVQATVRVNKAGCLDACEFGASIVVYPDGVWYGGVTVADVDEIVDEHIANDRPVARLRIRDPRYKQQ